jgi:hypothetical protein
MMLPDSVERILDNPDISDEVKAQARKVFFNVVKSSIAFEADVRDGEVILTTYPLRMGAWNNILRLLGLPRRRVSSFRITEKGLEK